MTFVVVLSVQHNEPPKRLDETVLKKRRGPDFVSGDVWCPPARPQSSLGNPLLMDNRITSKAVLRVLKSFKQGIATDSLVHVDETVCRMRHSTELYRLPVVSTAWIMDGAGIEEGLAFKSGRGLVDQPLRRWFRIAL